mgnify:CR=1 FL=1
MEPLSDFSQKVYRFTALIPRGRVSTYAALAKAIGKTGAARAVGNALNKNPYAPQVPCHRVVRSDGAVGGFALGTNKKISMLKKEGLIIKKQSVDLQKYLYEFKA